MKEKINGIFNQLKNATASPKRRAAIIAASLFFVLLFGHTFAWYVNKASNEGSSFNTGTLQFEAKGYANGESGDYAWAQIVNEGGDQVSDSVAPLFTVKNATSGDVSSAYIMIKNTGSLDLDYFLSFEISNPTGSEYLGGYWYRLTDITSVMGITDVSKAEAGLENYASANKPVKHDPSGICSSNCVCTERNSDLGKTNAITKLSSEKSIVTLAKDGVHFYRLDFGLGSDHIMSEYTSSSFSVKTTVNATQVGAWSNTDGTTTHLVSTAAELEKAIRDSIPGDTIKLMNHVEYEGDISLNKCVNLSTGIYKLTVNGNITYEFASEGALSIDTSEGGSIHLARKDASGGNFTITAPNAAVNFTGSAANEDIVMAGEMVVKANYENGWTLSDITIVTAVNHDHKAVYVESDTKVTVSSGVKLERIEATINSSNIKIINNGTVNSISLVNMLLIRDQQSPQIYIQNYGTINTSISIPGWSEKYVYNELTGEVTGNTLIIQEIGSNDLSVSGNGTEKFKDSDIDVTEMNTYVEQLTEGDDTALRVYLVNRSGNKAWTLQEVLDEYFIKKSGVSNYDSTADLAKIKKLELVTVGSKFVVADDFKFMNISSVEVESGSATTIKDVEYMPALEEIDFTRATTENNAIPDRAFADKKSLKTVILPSNLLKIGSEAFDGTGVETLTIPSSVNTLGNNCFAADSYIYFKSYTPATGITDAKNLGCKFFFVHENAYSTYTGDAKWTSMTNFIYRNAVEADDEINFVRMLADGGYEIVLYRGQEFDITVGTGLKVDGQDITVTKVGEKAYIHAKGYSVYDSQGKNYLKNIQFNSTVGEIGKNAFASTRIETAKLGNVKIVGDRAFSVCSLLNEIDFGNVTDLGSRVFENCTSLTVLNLANVKNVGERAFFRCYKLCEIDLPAIEVFKDEPFYDCTSLTVVRLGPNFRECALYVFINVPALKEVYLDVPSSETLSIARLAVGSDTARFYVPYEALDTYTSIFGNKVVVKGEKIGEVIHTVKYNNEVVATYNLGEYVIYDLGNNDAMLSCYNGADISGNYTVPESIDGKKIVAIGNSAYQVIQFNSCTLMFPTSVKSVGSYAFQNRSGIIGTLDLNAVESVGTSAFSGVGADNLTAAELMNVGNSAFRNCPNLREAKLPGAQYLGLHAFSGCAVLKSMYFEQAVDVSRAYPYTIFDGCTNLNSITINKVLEAGEAPYLGRFNGSNKIDLIVPYTSMNYYKTTPGSNDFPSTTFRVVPFGEMVLENNITYYVNKINNGTEYELVAITTNYRDLVISSNLNGYRLTKISQNAFDSATLVTSITLPRYFEHYENDSFAQLTGLTAINVDANNPYFTSIDGVLFTKDAKELVYYPQAKAGEAYAVPAGTEVIRTAAFKNVQNVTSLTFNAELKVISANAFPMQSSLTNVTFLGTTPAYMGNNAVFDASVSGFAIKVPAGYVDIYKNANGFIEYKNYIS